MSDVKRCRKVWAENRTVEGVFLTSRFSVGWECGLAAGHDGPHKSRHNGQYAGAPAQAILTWER